MNLLLAQARAHVTELRAMLDDPEASGGLGMRKRAAMRRAAREREQRVAAAIAQLPQLEARQLKLAARKSGREKSKLREPRGPARPTPTRG